LLGIFFSIILISISVDGQGLGDIWPKAKVRIIDFQTQNNAYAGEMFKVNITIENNRLFPVQLSVRIDLLNGMLECMKKEIGKEGPFTIGGKSKVTKNIDCIIREGDIDWYKEEYNVKAIVFREYPIIDRSVQCDISTVRGIHVKSPFSEKNKAKILDVQTPNILKENENEFDVELLIKNDGHYPIDIWACVDLVEKSSVIPELEDYIDLKGLSTERKEIGKCMRYIPVNPGCEQPISIHCNLSRSEISKKRFNIQAVLFVELDGNEFTVDMSSLYGIYHEQPLCRDRDCWFIYGGIIIALISGILIFLFIRRRRYHF